MIVEVYDIFQYFSLFVIECERYNVKLPSSFHLNENSITKNRNDAELPNDGAHHESSRQEVWMNHEDILG